MKKLLFVLMLLVLTSVVVADKTVVNQFYESIYLENGELVTDVTKEVTNVKALGFICGDEACTYVTDTLEFNVATSGNTNQLAITFPTKALYESTGGYGIYFYDNDRIVSEQFAKVSGSSSQPQYVNHAMAKMEVCRVVIDEFVVENSVYPNQPMMIDILTYLDSTVHSPIQHAGPLAYVPEELSRQYQVGAEVVLEIVDADNNVVYTDSSYELIDFSGQNRVLFEYTPEDMGRFTARVTATADDSKCLSTQSHFSQAQFSVVEQNPQNLCYTLLKDLKVSPEYAVEGDTVDITYQKISNMYDEFNQLHVLDTEILIEIAQNGEIVYSDAYFLFANENVEDFSWDINSVTLEQPGHYAVSVTGKAAGCPAGFRNEPFTVSQSTFASPIVDEPDPVDPTDPEPVNVAPQFLPIPLQSMEPNQEQELFNVLDYVYDVDGDAVFVSLGDQIGDVSCYLEQDGGFVCQSGSQEVCSTVDVVATDLEDETVQTVDICVETSAQENLPPVVLYPEYLTINAGSGEILVLDLLASSYDPEGVELTYSLEQTTGATMANCKIELNGLYCDAPSTLAGTFGLVIVTSDGVNAVRTTHTLYVNKQTSNLPPVTAYPSQVEMMASDKPVLLLDLAQYSTDPEGADLSYYLLDDSNLSDPSCYVQYAHLYCYATQRGDITLNLITTDGANHVLNIIDVVVHKVENEKSDGIDTVGTTLNVMRFHFPDVVAGETELPIRLSVDNNGPRLTDLRVKVSVPELGIRQSLYFADLSSSDSQGHTVVLPLTGYERPGYYTVRLSISSDGGLERIIHREVRFD